jgi:hypothetical protein
VKIGSPFWKTITISNTCGVGDGVGVLVVVGVGVSVWVGVAPGVAEGVGVNVGDGVIVGVTVGVIVGVGVGVPHSSVTTIPINISFLVTADK